MSAQINSSRAFNVQVSTRAGSSRVAKVSGEKSTGSSISSAIKSVDPNAEFKEALKFSPFTSNATTKDGAVNEGETAKSEKKETDEKGKEEKEEKAKAASDTAKKIVSKFEKSTAKDAEKSKNQTKNSETREDSSLKAGEIRQQAKESVNEASNSKNSSNENGSNNQGNSNNEASSKNEANTIDKNGLSSKGGNDKSEGNSSDKNGPLEGREQDRFVNDNSQKINNKVNADQQGRDITNPLDPNKTESRFDKVAGKEFPSDPESAAKNFGLAGEPKAGDIGAQATPAPQAPQQNGGGPGGMGSGGGIGGGGGPGGGNGNGIGEGNGWNGGADPIQGPEGPEDPGVQQVAYEEGYSFDENPFGS